MTSPAQEAQFVPHLPDKLGNSDIPTPIPPSVREDKPHTPPLPHAHSPGPAGSQHRNSVQCSKAREENDLFYLLLQYCLYLKKTASFLSLGIKGGYTCKKSLGSNLTEGGRDLEVEAAVI